MRDPLRKRRLSLIDFLLRSRRKNYPHDTTWHSSDTFSEPDLPRFRDTMTTCLHQPAMDSSLSALTRATTYLKVISRKLHGTSTQSTEPADKPEEILVPVSTEEVRVEDIFHSELNKCNAEALPELRKQRSVIAPIICYESDSEDSDSETSLPAASRSMCTHQTIDCSTIPSSDKAIQARMEALLMQQQLLGWDHPDVQFLASHIRQHRRRQSSATSCDSDKQ